VGGRGLLDRVGRLRGRRQHRPFGQIARGPRRRSHSVLEEHSDQPDAQRDLRPERNDGVGGRGGGGQQGARQETQVPRLTECSLSTFHGWEREGPLVDGPRSAPVVRGPQMLNGLKSLAWRFARFSPEVAVFAIFVASILRNKPIAPGDKSTAKSA